jgi:NNP family nitrate/nitrite transporter-like MFS transporter
MAVNRQSNYKWLVLILGMVTHIFVAAMPMMCMPVLFNEISKDLNLDLVQLGVIWGLTSLPSLFAAFAVGLISDKFGAARTLGVACLLQGVFGALRGTSESYLSLAIFMFLFGLFCIPLTLATHKAAGQWFPQHQLGLANGLLATAYGAGNMLGALVSATTLSPLLGGWRPLMFVYGGIAVVIGLLWLRIKRDPVVAQTIPFRQALLQVMRSKGVWLLALFQLCIMGYWAALTGYVPLYLRSVGWTAASADGALAAFSAASVAGAIPLSMLSDKIGRRKTILYFALLLVIAGVILLTLFGSQAAWPALIMAGIVEESFFAISITMIIETKGVGAAYSGTALGLTGMFAGLGGFFGPPISNRLAETEPRFAFLFWIAIVAVALVAIYFIEETGWKKKSR